MVLAIGPYRSQVAACRKSKIALAVGKVLYARIAGLYFECREITTGGAWCARIAAAC